MNDNEAMLKVLEYAKFSLENDRYPAHSILVNKYGEVIAQSPNLSISENDPTAHSEILAIREASKKIKTLDLSGLTLYTAIEPCMMCISACSWSKIKRIVYALGKDKLAPEDFESNINSKEITTRLNSYIELIHLPQHEQRMIDLVGIWQDRLKRYWK